MLKQSLHLHPESKLICSAVHLLNELCAGPNDCTVLYAAYIYILGVGIDYFFNLD